MTCSALQYFSSLSHKRNNFRKIVIQHAICDFKLSPCSACCMTGNYPEGSIKRKMCVLVFSATLSETVLTLRRNEQGMNKNICWSSRKVPVTRYSCHILMTFACSREIFEKYSDMKFHENPCSRSRVVPCRQTDGWTDRHT